MGEQVGELERAAQPGTRARRGDTVPAVALSWPEIRLKYVVLPAPLGPTMAVSVPGAKAQVTAFTATWPPKRTVRSWVASIV